jgi:peptide/nickel transport system ATP-binding protein
VPPLRALRTGHEVACHWAEEIQDGKIQPHEVAPVFDPGTKVEAVPEPPPV